MERLRTFTLQVLHTQRPRNFLVLVTRLQYLVHAHEGFEYEPSALTLVQRNSGQKEPAAVRIAFLL